MMFPVKHAVFIAILGLGTVSVARADADYERLRHYADKIVASMPSTWRAFEEKTGVIPYGHYDGLKYEGPGGLLLVLVGPQDMFYEWKDESGAWHEKSFTKEAIELWIMPPEYHLSWKRFFVMKSPVPADLIFSGDAVKVYGMPSRRPTSQHHKQLSDDWFNYEVLPQATTLGPKLSPLSWTTWKGDIKEVLQEAE
jgi:hypothetical protein